MCCKYVKIVPLAYKSYNYGGTLQYYALQSAIQMLGYKAKVLDIDSLGEYLNSDSLKKSEDNKSLFKKIIHKIIWEYAHLKTKNIKCMFAIRNQKFDVFRADYIKSEHHDSFDAINDEACAFVAGSDQIWNPQWAKTTHFLQFADKEIPRIIYAASVGRKSLPVSQCKVYSKLLTDITAVSVREGDIAEQMRSYLNKDIQLVLDPVFLIREDEWREVANPDKNGNRNYTFCYLIGDSLHVRKELIKYKKKNGEHFISIPYVTQKYIVGEKYADQLLYDAGPTEFINLILKADKVITDSFHAVAFSIIYHKDFIVLDREPDSGEMLSRIITVLNYFGLEDHLVRSPFEYRSRAVEWRKIDEKIEELRQNSLFFMSSNLRKQY